MIEQIDAGLRDWVCETLDDTGVEVSFEAPGKIAAIRAVGLYLFEIVPMSLSRSERRPPLQVALRYLVTAWAEKAEQAHQLLVKLMLRAMESTRWQVEEAVFPIDAWSALGLAPRPSFVLRATMRQDRPEKLPKLVRKPPVVDTRPIAALSGRVVGQNDVPIVGARVDILSLNLTTSTDSHGDFRFTTVPASPQKLRLRVKAKGRELAIDTPDQMNRNELFMIQFPPIIEE